MEINDKAVVVLIDSSVFFFEPDANHELLDSNPPCVENVTTALMPLVRGEGVFSHTNKAGVSSLIKLVAGSHVQIMPGRIFRDIIREQRAAQMFASPSAGKHR